MILFLVHIIIGFILDYSMSWRTWTHSSPRELVGIVLLWPILLVVVSAILIHEEIKYGRR